MDRLPDGMLSHDLLARAVSLESEGVYDLAWCREDALRVIHLAADVSVGILGVTVWVERAGRWSVPGDGWYCEPFADESSEAFARRSCSGAAAYVTDHPMRKPWFGRPRRYVYDIGFQ